MATRKDLLKAQSFTSRRMIAAFVDRDPDNPTPPLRRVGVATFVSVLLGVVLLAGTALIVLAPFWLLRLLNTQSYRAVEQVVHTHRVEAAAQATMASTRDAAPSVSTSTALLPAIR